MADPVSSSTSGPLASFEPPEVDASPTARAASTSNPPADSTNHTERWSGEVCSAPAHEADTCDGTTAADIQRQYAQALADRAALGRSLDFMGDPLGALATAQDSFFGREVRDAGLLVASRATQPRSTFFGVAARVPNDVVRQGVEQRLRTANPKLSRDELATRTDLAMKHLGECVKIESAQRMRHAAQRRLEAAANEFASTAKKPDDLAKLSATINALESPRATPGQRAQASVLRATLGLENDGRRVTPDALAAALTSRATLMHEEAGKLAGAGENTLYRALLTHDVRGLVADEAKVRPGSFAAQGLDAVRARGESDEEQLATAKLLTSVALAGATAGLGLGVLAGMGVTAALNAPEVLVAHHEVGGAAAGASAGTAALDAQEVAERRAWLKTWEAAASVAFAGALGAGGGHAVESVADHTARHIAQHAALHGAADGALMLGAHALESEKGEASGEDALSRARRAAGN